MGTLVNNIHQSRYVPFPKIYEYNRTWGIKNTLFDRNKTYSWNIFARIDVNIFEESSGNWVKSVLSLFL